jgi:hypothetical protein
MREKPPGRTRGWWAKYRTWIIVVLAVYLLIIGVFLLLSGGAQWMPFRYEIF